jgi:hypothetical protein
MRLKTHRYRGYEIRPTTYAQHPERWYIVSHHGPSGIEWDEQECKRCWTLQQAREHIDWTITTDSMYD